MTEEEAKTDAPEERAKRILLIPCQGNKPSRDFVEGKCGCQEEILDELRAVRDEALAEAARLADANPAGHEIAEAIRRLAGNS